MVHKLKQEVSKICERLAVLYSECRYEDFVLELIDLEPNVFDLIFAINARPNTCDLTDEVKEVMMWFDDIYMFKRIQVDKTSYEIDFTLRNIYDVLQLEIILSKLLYLYYLDTKLFCIAFESLPEPIYDKIDDLRETSFKTRDSVMHKRSLIKAKFISFEYFNNLKAYGGQ